MKFSGNMNTSPIVNGVAYHIAAFRQETGKIAVTVYTVQRIDGGKPSNVTAPTNNYHEAFRAWLERCNDLFMVKVKAA